MWPGKITPEIENKWEEGIQITRACNHESGAKKRAEDGQGGGRGNGGKTRRSIIKGRVTNFVKP